MKQRGNVRGKKPAAPGPLELRLLGPLTLLRDGKPVVLARSRKVRALLAYLAMAPRPLSRSQLCELLWDSPSDPRGELRWCLSRIRAAIDDDARARIVTKDDAISLDLSDLRVDALGVTRALGSGVESIGLPHARELVAMFAGDFLEGLDIDSPGYDGWLVAQRRRLRAGHAALLEQLATRLPPAEAFTYLEQWLALSPFDRQVHERMLATLAQQGRVREGEEHLATATALFEAEGLDGAPLREAWRLARKAADKPAAVSIPAEKEPGAAATRRASIAVMPFHDDGGAKPRRGGMAEALAHDITTRLAKLRSLFVIAQGSTLALHERRIGPEQAGRMLNVDYVLAGSLQRIGARMRVAVELTETRTARIVWSETLDHAQADALELLEQLGNRIVASVAGEIETLERNRAVLLPPASLDAWEAHHRGLWHAYRFTRIDNDRAGQFFRTAVKLDPTFSRAHSGLSFVHFQNAFQGWGDRAAETASAYETAQQGLLVDDRDPAAHWSMGRALWLRGEHQPAVAELTHATELSPNFAMGHYALAFVQAQAGDAEAAIELSDYSRALSPFDPLLFGFLGSRAIALVRLGRYDEAADWAVKAAARPNAHPHIHALAAYALALAGNLPAARTYAAAVRRSIAGYGLENFLGAFRPDREGVARFREGARRSGLW